MSKLSDNFLLRSLPLKGKNLTKWASLGASSLGEGHNANAFFQIGLNDLFVVMIYSNCIQNQIVIGKCNKCTGIYDEMFILLFGFRHLSFVFGNVCESS